MEKTLQTDLIAGLQVGKKDLSGITVVNILARGNEYCIYEIECCDINDRLKVVIDGLTDQSEAQLSVRYNSVKQKYVKAKGLLYRSSNLGMMKSRVAHALATCLSTTEQGFDGNPIFESLINEIETEQRQNFWNRVCYFAPVTISILVSLAFSYYLKEGRLTSDPDWQVASGFLAASLGAGASIFTGTRRLHFEEYPFQRFYFFIGLERVLLAYTVGAVALIAVKAGLISPAVMERNYWALLLVIVVAGFSEHFVPSILKKVDT